MADYYDYAGYGAFKGTAGASRLAGLARRLGLRDRHLRYVEHARKDLPVLEIGCGGGEFVKAMRDAGFRDVRGIDLSPTYVMTEGCEIADAAQFLDTLQPGSLGLVVALDVFEHFDRSELMALLALIKERLHEEGRLIFRVPNMASPLGLALYFGDLSHRLPMNETSVRQLAFDAGLEVVCVRKSPQAYPRSLATLLGYLAWPIYNGLTRLALASFGIRHIILTPNLIAEIRLARPR